MLVEADPWLAALELDIPAVAGTQSRRRDRHLCANAIWYRYGRRGEDESKRRCIALVGWGASASLIGSRAVPRTTSVAVPVQPAPQLP
jgi:hypothetical protein